MRIIPGKTKIRIELFKGVTLADFLIGLMFAGFVLLAITSPIAGKLYIAAGLLFIGVMLLVKIGDEPNYTFFLSILRHLAYRKTYSKGEKGKKEISNLSSFKRIEDNLIVYEDYYGAAIEIPPVEFRFFSSYRRTVSIDECLANVLRTLNPSYAANLVKIERKVPYDGYLENEQAKLDELRHCFECAMISEKEYQAKCEVIFDRITELQELNTESRTVAPYYYLVFFDADKNQLRQLTDSAINVLERGEMQPKRLNSKELAVFLKYTNEIDFDEKEIDELEEADYASWAMPNTLKVRASNYQINDVTAYTMAISNYPTRIGDAWLASVMSIPATKVVVKMQPMDKQKTVKNIDRSISELRARYNESGVDSTRIELADHIQSLTELLNMLQSDNEVLLNTDIYITCYDVQQTRKEGREQAVEDTSRATITNMRTVVRREYREQELRTANLQFNQMEGYIGSQISGYDPLVKTFGRGIPGSTAAAMYPWIFAHVQDPKGVKLGSEDGVPVFIDMFRRDSERVNSNMVIVGKSGSGKSYAAKSILVNLAADNSKIFVLDPENEYTELASNLHGKFINVGNAQQGRMNPFQIITALDDEEAEGGVTGSYASHMQFLEEFFKQILPDCDKESLEYLNSMADRVYMNRGITAETNLSLLRAGDYPVFDDLYDEILKEFQATDNDYLRSILRTLMNYVSKFSAGGRNANIWNGPSTISTDENFTVFNFQSLLAGGNSTITNAQMMLVMKYIDNEIIKNRDYNNRYGTHRKIVVVIDEAHVFIDEKYPIGLDFMFQLAKRIRKYNGMQIVITQNIKDFVGSEEISRKSSAIINACQYSFIFPLAPNDMDDLCKLYDKAGGINESEQEQIVTAPRGNAFVILSSTSRSSFQVEVPEDVVSVFEEKDIPSRYFNGEDGQEVWEEYLGDSREIYLSNVRVRDPEEEAEKDIRPIRVNLVEVSQEEYELEQQIAVESEKPFVPEKPEKSVSFTEETEEVQEYKAPAVVLKETAPAEAPAPQIIIRETASNNGEMVQMVSELRNLVENMGRISYDAMVSDIMGRIGNVVSQSAAVAEVEAAPAPIPERTTVTEHIEEREEDDTEEPNLDELLSDTDFDDESDDDDDDDNESFDYLDMLLNSFDDDSYGSEDDELIEFDNSESAEEAPKEEKTMEDVLREMAMEEDLKEFMDRSNSGQEEDNEESDEIEAENEDNIFEEEEEEFDIMAFLEKTVAEVETVSILDDMISNGEKKRTITLDMLASINANRKNR